MKLEPDKRIEYLHKKSTYIFPRGSKIFVNENKLTVEINDKKIKNIASYLSNSNIAKKLNCKIGLPITAAGSQLAKEYQAIADYIDAHPKFNFLHFDYATSHDLALCTFFKPMDFSNLIHEINKEMPYLINIFHKPLIHLKEIEIIQPVDAAKRISRNTITHLSAHTENWKSIDSKTGDIVPAKLLTRVYDDDYCIYENIVFRDLIDKILLFLRKRIYYFTEIFETFKESIQLDPVNRFNHQMYYLAVGKLYVGFYKMEDSANILAILENAKNLYKRINRYCNRPTYAKITSAKPIVGEVKKTNILAMHKDYRHVYSLTHKFNDNSINLQGFSNYLVQAEGQQSYELFCQMLVLFAVSNFNMSCLVSNDIFFGGKINAAFKFNEWNLTLKCERSEVLGFNTIIMNVMHQEKCVKYLLIPMGYYIANEKKQVYENIIERLHSVGDIYDKYVFFEPFNISGDLNSYSTKYQTDDGTNLFYSVLPISLSEINSFRRIQKLLFECLVLSDESYEICAFCGEKTTKLSNNNCLCKKCRTTVKKLKCEHCAESFTAAYANVKRAGGAERKKSDEETPENIDNFYKQEKLHSFRNTVAIGKNGFICPYCGGENNI